MKSKLRSILAHFDRSGVNYRHPLNFAVNADNRDTAKFKTAKFVSYTWPTELGGWGALVLLTLYQNMSLIDLV